MASTVAPSPTNLAAARSADASTSVPKIGTIAEWYSSSTKNAGRSRRSILCRLVRSSPWLRR